MVSLLFYVLSAVAVACAFGVVVARSPMQSILSLLGSFVCLAVIYLLIGFQFIALAQVLVYAGAIMVLFLFVVMLLNLTDKAPAQSLVMGLFNGRVLASIAAFLGLAAAGVMAAGGAAFTNAGIEAAAIEGPRDPLLGIAELLFSKYMLPFEAASLLLLATMVGVMLLAKRQRKDSATAAGSPSDAVHGAEA